MSFRKAALILILFAMVIALPRLAAAIQCACGICCYRGACSQGSYDPWCGYCDPETVYSFTECDEKVYYGSGVYVKQGTGGRCVYRCNFNQSCTDYASCGPTPVDTFDVDGTDKFKTDSSYPPGSCPAYDCATQMPAAQLTFE